MKVFVLGASGYLGTAVSRRLRESGHEVIGLARSPQAAAVLDARGDGVVRGSLFDPSALAEGICAADAVVDLVVATVEPLYAPDVAVALNVLLEGAGEGTPFVLTSTAALYGATHGEFVTENSPLHPPRSLAHLPDLEHQVLDNPAGVRGIVIRPALVYGRGGGPILHELERIRAARRAPYLGDGSQLVSTVHVDDLADLYLLALEGSQGRTILNAASAAPVTRRELAVALAVAAGLPWSARSVDLEGAARLLGPADASTLALSAQVNSHRAGILLGWQPRRVSLVEELRHGGYQPVLVA